MRWDEVLGIAEGLDRPEAQDDALAGALRRVELPVQLRRIEDARHRLDPVPVRSQAYQIERIRQQPGEGPPGVEAEVLALPGPEADSQPGTAAATHRHLPPPPARPPLGAPDPEFTEQRHGAAGAAGPGHRGSP